MILDIFESIVRNSKWISLWKQEYVHVQQSDIKWQFFLSKNDPLQSLF